MISPSHFKALFNRSFCYEKLGQLEQSVVDSTAALQLQPEHAGCLVNRALTFDKMGRLEESLADFNAAIKYGAPVLPTLTTR